MNRGAYLATFFPASPPTDCLYFCVGATKRLILPAASEDAVRDLFKQQAGEDVVKCGIVPR